MTSVLLAFSGRRLEAHHCSTSPAQCDRRVCRSSYVIGRTTGIELDVVGVEMELYNVPVQQVNGILRVN